MNKTQFEPIQAKHMLNSVKAPSMPFDWSINPYRGCQHGCSFCYARSTHAFLGQNTDDTFQHHIFYKANAKLALEKQIIKMLRSKDGRRKLGRVAIGTATDPYQPVEKRANLTRQCLEVLASYGIPVSITTRSPLILKDVDLLQAMKGSSVNISINTLNAKILRDFEPMTPSPHSRFDTIARLTDRGIETGVFMAPILPYITDNEQDLEAVIDKASRSGANFVMGSVLRLSTSEVKSWFFATLQQHYPHLAKRYAAIYQGSGYASSLYRDTIRAKLNVLLERYKLASYEPYKRVTPISSTSSCEEMPVQLSFSFEGDLSAPNTMDSPTP
ncbi:radical SAM protein [Paenibacillus allorhizosphaerae]|uniref:Radical SAM core domain-containing protein n=1 Tax=Paenibacillus allorhizosphaerae TaxID=2849866 RepID=A0ABM8VM03_9BACL|nr:radical SAM protein [Paenibacillus allorhizosphaerae]CAG7649198.1 hypothetical protein PAECIP111802_04430 [Paenibacillus allorhizosphaerae]